MNWDILGPFSFTSCPNEINILKLEQLDNQMTIPIYERPHCIRDRKSNTLGFFLSSGCWISGQEFRIPEFFKCLKYEKKDVTLR